MGFIKEKITSSLNGKNLGKLRISLGGLILALLVCNLVLSARAKFVTHFVLHITYHCLLLLVVVVVVEGRNELNFNPTNQQRTANNQPKRGETTNLERLRTGTNGVNRGNDGRRLKDYGDNGKRGKDHYLLAFQKVYSQFSIHIQGTGRT